MFEKIDTNGNRALDPDEVRAYLSERNTLLCDDFFAELRTDADGRISFQEFAEAMSKHFDDVEDENKGGATTEGEAFIDFDLSRTPTDVLLLLCRSRLDH